MERVRHHVPELAALLGIVAIGIVVAAAGGTVPAAWLPGAPGWVLAGIPHVNAVISVVAIATIAGGWRAIRRGDVTTHRRAMFVATGLFAAFLVLYLYRLVLIGGASPFTGPTVVYQFVYLPVLLVHMGLAMVCIPLVIYVLLLGLTRPVHEIAETAHARVGRVAALLWMVSYAGGVVVYLLLHILF